MSYIIEKHIKSTHEMQRDLLADGEYPVPYSEVDYYADMLVDCSEEPRDLAELIAKGAAKQVHEYAESAKLYRGCITAQQVLKVIYSKCCIYDYTGKLCAELCWVEDDSESQVLVLGAIYNKFPKAIWI